MSESQVHEGLANPAGEASSFPVSTPLSASTPQFVGSNQGCATCGAIRAQTQVLPDTSVYVLGDVHPRFPNLAVEKEAIGAMARADTKGLSNEAALQKVLRIRDNTYLVREMCWVLLVQEVETYILVPRYAQDYQMLIEASQAEVSAVIGTIGSIANPNVCNGLTVQFLIFDMIYSFDKSSFIAEMPVPEGADADTFRRSATDIFNQVASLIGDGMGMKRALAYLLVKDPMFYQVIANAFDQNSQLTAVDLKPAPVRGSQSLVDVIVRTQHRNTGVQSSTFARVNLDQKLPYVLNYWQPYLGQ